MGTTLPVLLVAAGWSLVWFAVGALVRGRRPGLGASMMLFGLSEPLAVAAESYAGAAPSPAVLRSVGLAIHSLQLAWLAYMAMTLLRLRASQRTARTRAAVTWAYGVVYTAAVMITADPRVRGLLAMGWAVLLAIGVGWVSARWLGSPSRLRRVRTVPTLIGIFTGSLVLVQAVGAARQGIPVWTGSLATSSPAGAAGVIGAVSFWLCLVAIPGSLLFGLLRERLALARVADLVARLGTVAVRELEPALADALGDPRLRLVVGGPPDPPVPPGRVASDVGDGVRLVHDPSLLSERGLLDAVRSAVALAIEREALQTSIADSVEQVRASRARIVDAADAARRQLERDLHDGAQQRLLSAGLALQAVEHRFGSERLPSGTEAMLTAARDEVRAALAELRELAQGIHPQVLTTSGLSAALHQLARRSPVPVRITGPTLPRLPAAVEATGYFVASEALANIAKHAQASIVVIAVELDAAQLTISVQDDGMGGATPTGGGGLSGLADRVAAVGGELRIDSPPGSGTTVVAVLPSG